jgi:hypothetical protein
VIEEQWALGHAIQWHIIQALKQRNITHYEIGWQFYGPQFAYLPTREEQQISFFKRGFGGFSVPLHRACKYYNGELFLEDFKNPIQTIADGWMAPKHAHP